jgi:NAD(P)-dependent dehydrogenase (short-subunit alcohol dehydrogenase family)
LSADIGWPDDVWADLRSHSALGRLATIEDVAEAAVYLGSAEAGFVTGTTLVVDGGLLARQITIAPDRPRAAPRVD